MFYLLGFLISIFFQTEDHTLVKAYPGIISRVEHNMVTFKSGKKIPYDDFSKKTTVELLEKPDIQDQFYYTYNQGGVPEKNNDAGRIRNDAFFKEIYGNTKEEVAKNLTTVIWCPKLVNVKLNFSKINNANLALIKVSKDLDEHPEWKKQYANYGLGMFVGEIEGKKLFAHNGANYGYNMHFHCIPEKNQIEILMVNYNPKYFKELNKQINNKLKIK